MLESEKWYIKKKKKEFIGGGGSLQMYIGGDEDIPIKKEVSEMVLGRGSWETWE